jgi:uncharacterized protein YceK
MKKIVMALAVINTVTLIGCASIVNGTTTPVKIVSVPDKAEFIIKNKDGFMVHGGTTPETVNLDNGSGYFSSSRYTVEYKKEGYQAVSAILNAELSGWYFGNLCGLLPGAIIGGIIIDPSTGGMWKLPEQAEMSLEKSK